MAAAVVGAVDTWERQPEAEVNSTTSVKSEIKGTSTIPVASPGHRCVEVAEVEVVEV